VHGKHFADGASVWPADYHLLGKDILTTHAVYWTTMLQALGMPQPKHILAHGWWLFDNARMSKTTGNVVNPMAMKDKYGVDVFRYFLIREMVVGQDASFSEDALVLRLNSDLANDVGNGLSRILKLAATGLDGKLTPVASEGEEEIALKQTAANAVSGALEQVNALKLSFAIEEVLTLIRAVNRYLEVKAPWKLAKEGPAGKDKLNVVLYHAAEALRIGFSLLHPVMPGKMSEALAALGIDLGKVPGSAPGDGSALAAGHQPLSAASPLFWGGYDYAKPLGQGVNLFPRVEVKPAAQPGQAAGGKAPQAAPADPFSQVHLKVARVESVEDHPNADSLYVLSLKIGEEQRTVCAGLKKHLSKDELKGRDVVMVYNLKPANLRGVESKGMILAAEREDGKVVPVSPDGAAPGDDVKAAETPFQPKPDLTLKEFDKAPLTVQAGQVRYRDRALLSPKGPISAQAKDGTAVK
jgi:methionyl-tRNA synthetase